MKSFSQVRQKILPLVAVCFLTATLFGVRLLDLQIIRGSDFLALAEANRMFKERLPAERGVIFDRYGYSLAFNESRYTKLENPSALYSPRQPISRDQALSLLATNSAIVDYQLERRYIFPEAHSHVLGFVGPVTSDDLKQDSRLHLTDTIGKMGLERLHDSSLRGLSGERLYEVDALGRRQHLIREKPNLVGQNLTTTLDPYLSQVAYLALENQRGAVVILDGETGAILSLVSKPTFNPSLLTTTYIDTQAERKRRREVAGFFDHPHNLFFNRAIGGTYPPGSIFKLVTALAALESGAVTANTIVTDTGVLTVGEYSYANWLYTQHGRVDGDISLQRALARSNDIYFYKAAEWAGPWQISEAARLFGLGELTGVKLSGEAKGLVPDPVWKEQNLGERWFLGNTYHLGIGQDNLLSTPLQLARMMQAFGNRGVMCQPTLVVEDENNFDCRSLGLSDEHLEIILKGSLDACSAGGTGVPFFDHNAQYRDPEASARSEVEQGAVACKTGTSEFGGTDERGFKKTHGLFGLVVGTEYLLDHIISQNEIESVPQTLVNGQTTLDHAQWLSRASEAGFPRQLVIMVLVESDDTQPYKEGSRDAAPVAKTVLDWMINGQLLDD